MYPAGSIPVWDLLVRCVHWLLAVGFFAAYFTRHSSGSIHEWLGYAVGVLVLIRVVWGFWGSRRARFSEFVRDTGHTRQYARDLVAGKQARYVGHNPLGGWMVLLLLSSVLLTCVSGWLYTTDRFWGIEWVEDLHDALTWLTFFFVALHVSGVVNASVHGRENLITAMIHGRKRPAIGSDID